MRRKHKHSSRKLPTDIHPRQLFGDGVGLANDAGKYYACGYCGFTCNVDRDGLGGENSRSGVRHSDFVAPEYDGSGDISSPLSTRLVLGGVSHVFVIMENDAAGDPKGVVHDFEHSVSTGCPLCGSTNWRGDYP